MQIIWYGTSCFKIICQELSILTDPFSPEKTGFKNPRITSEIVVFSSPTEEKKVTSDAFIFSTPGEVEIKNIFIQGIPHFKDRNLKTIYKITAEEIKICFLGEISQELSSEEIDKLGKIDILILPVSKTTFSAKRAREVVEEIEPSLVVPSCWKKREELADFIKETGLKDKGDLDKWKIKKKDISAERIELVILKPNV